MRARTNTPTTGPVGPNNPRKDPWHVAGLTGGSCAIGLQKCDRGGALVLVQAIGQAIGRSGIGHAESFQHKTLALRFQAQWYQHERQIPPGGQWNFRRRRPRGRSKAPHTRCSPRNRAQLTACLKDFSRSHCGRLGDFSIGVLTSFVFSLSHNGLPFPPTLFTLLQLVEAHFPTSFVLRRIR